MITTAVLGGTLCCLLLVMALGCACKLYSLHTVGYRNNMRLSQSVQSTHTNSSSVIAPLINTSNNMPTIASTSSSSSANESNTSTSSPTLFTNLASILRRPFAPLNSTTASSAPNSSSNNNATSASLISSALLAHTNPQPHTAPHSQFNLGSNLNANPPTMSASTQAWVMPNRPILSFFSKKNGVCIGNA